MYFEKPYDGGGMTFGEPGGNAPFSFHVSDALRNVELSNPLAALNTYATKAAIDVARRPEAYADIFGAAERYTRLVDNINAGREALAEAVENRNETVFRATGVRLENPIAGGYAIEASRRLAEARGRGDRVPEYGPHVDDERVRVWQEKLDDVATSHPDKMAALEFLQPLDQQAQAIKQSARDQQVNADKIKRDPVAGTIAEFAGSLTGLRRDPLMVYSMFAGPGMATGRTALARIGLSALWQGLFNAGLQGIAEPVVQANRASVGAPTGMSSAAMDIGAAFLFGAVPGAAIQGGIELFKPGAHMVRLATGAPEPGDVTRTAKDLGVKLDPKDERTVQAAEADLVDAHNLAADRPAGVSEAQHEDLMAQAVRHAEDPQNEPPPELPIVAAARKADEARVVDEALPAKSGDTFKVDGKPVAFERLKPSDLEADAATFQYKGGGDAAGVTERLRSVESWDPLASGKVLVFERADGSRVVADGHQRLGLAKRLGDDGARLDGFVFREADGWTPADVRAIAAKKNMQEGSGDALDAARILRERPDILDNALPVTSPMMKNAIALSRLSDAAFGMAINGVVPPNYAAAVGAMVADPLQHAAVIADLARFKPETDREARILIGEIMSAGFRAEEQISLFGETMATRSLLAERVKVLDGAIKALVRDKKLFGTLAEKADAIEAAGNALVRQVNETRARDAAALQDLLVRLAQRTGPVSDALNRAAADVAGGGKASRAADAFLDHVRDLLDRDGLTGLLATPELRPAKVVEPGTDEAARLAEGAAASRSESVSAETAMPAAHLAEPEKTHPASSPGQQSASGEPSLFDAVAVASREDGKDARLISQAAALEDADKTAFHSDLITSCKG